MCLKSSFSRVQIYSTNIFWVTWIKQSFHYAAVKNENFQWFSAEPGLKESPNITSEVTVSNSVGSRGKREFCMKDRQYLNNCTHSNISTALLWPFSMRQLPWWWLVQTDQLESEKYFWSLVPPTESVWLSEYCTSAVIADKYVKSITTTTNYRSWILPWCIFSFSVKLN